MGRIGFQRRKRTDVIGRRESYSGRTSGICRLRESNASKCAGSIQCWDGPTADHGVERERDQRGYEITVNTTQPGLLAPAAFNIAGKQYVVAILPDGTFVLPQGAIAGVNSRPARPGETATMYGVGFGPVIPNIPAGQIVGQINNLSLPLSLTFGSTPVTISYKGLAPNFVGLYQFNVVIPGIANNTAVPLSFTLGGPNGTQTLYTAVSQ